MLKGNWIIWMAKLKYVLRCEKLHKTSKQLNDMQDQFSFKNDKNPKQNKTKQKYPPTKTASDPDFFQASSTPSMGARFSKELSSHLWS